MDFDRYVPQHYYFFIQVSPYTIKFLDNQQHKVGRSTISSTVFILFDKRLLKNLYKSACNQCIPRKINVKCKFFFVKLTFFRFIYLITCERHLILTVLKLWWPQLITIQVYPKQCMNLQLYPKLWTLSSLYLEFSITDYIYPR